MSVFHPILENFARVFAVFAASASILLSAGATQAEKEHPYRKRILEIDRLLNSVKYISQTNLSPDGKMVAWSVQGATPGTQSIRISPVDLSQAPQQVTAGDPGAPCSEQSPVWSPDGSRIAFLSDCGTRGQLQLYTVDWRSGSHATPLTHISGHISSPRWSPDGKRIAYLAVENATRAPSPMAAIKAPVGVIDEQETTEIQHLAVADVSSAQTRELTPPGLYIFEFDWSPDSQTLAFTAAPPPGDDNWYIARLYRQSLAEAQPRLIYKPALQIAVPRWSPDGTSIAFISGLMSDEGGTGGEISLVSSAGGVAKNLTPGRSSSPSWLSWRSGASLLFTEFKGGSTAVSLLDIPTLRTQELWQGGETIHASGDVTSLSVAKNVNADKPLVALVRSSWTTPPEVWAGAIGSWRQVSHENSNIQISPARAESLSWSNDSFHVQGWLLYPKDFDPKKRYPLLVSVHGGPAWIFTPKWAPGDFDLAAFSEAGYFILFPNPRGSYGQGERFTQANRRDWGFGDLSDITTGVDAVLKQQPVDPGRVGILGWSYGGSTTMIAVTRTSRFRAAVAGAAACNLVSYYGQNSIDQWMLPYFGASAYDDPAAYMRSSALSYVKQAKTPTLIVVGERDGEAPPAQSFEFWHALKTMHVPTQLVVYPGEGHAFGRQEDRIDLIERSLEWFMRFMPPQ